MHRERMLPSHDHLFDLPDGHLDEAAAAAVLAPIPTLEGLGLPLRPLLDPQVLGWRPGPGLQVHQRVSGNLLASDVPDNLNLRRDFYIMGKCWKLKGVSFLFSP